MAFPQPGSKTAAPTALKIAEADSRDCVACQGFGMVSVYAAGYTGDAISYNMHGIPYVSRIMSHCWCPLGRLLRANAPEDVRRMIPDLTDVLAGRSMWLVDDPTEEPLDDPSSPADKAAFRALWRQIRESRIGQPIP